MTTIESSTDKENLILRAAMEEFGEKGVHGARMQSIANRAGVNKALLHYYFRSKDQLYKRVLELISVSFWEQLKEKIDTLAADDFEGAVRAIGEIIVTSAREIPHSTVLLSEFASGGQYISQMDVMQRALADAQGSVLGFFENLIQQGKVKPYHPMKIFVSVLGMCWNIFLSHPFASVIYHADGTPIDDAFYDDYIELIVELTTSGLQK